MLKALLSVHTLLFAVKVLSLSTPEGLQRVSLDVQDQSKGVDASGKNSTTPMLPTHSAPEDAITTSKPALKRYLNLKDGVRSPSGLRTPKDFLSHSEKLNYLLAGQPGVSTSVAYKPIKFMNNVQKQAKSPKKKLLCCHAELQAASL